VAGGLSNSALRITDISANYHAPALSSTTVFSSEHHPPQLVSIKNIENASPFETLNAKERSNPTVLYRFTELGPPAAIALTSVA
jgi:hypothetical protein